MHTSTSINYTNYFVNFTSTCDTYYILTCKVSIVDEKDDVLQVTKEKIHFSDKIIFKDSMGNQDEIEEKL